jgi:hypothetical protein
MRLELGSQTLDLIPANGFFVREFNLGYPVPRTVVDNRPNIDGTDDRTRFFGSRVVSLSVDLIGDKWTLLDQLSPYMIPGARPFLVFDDAAQPRRFRLRAADESKVIQSPTTSQNVFLQWVAPDGVSETVAQAQEVVTASVGVAPGFTFDISFNLNFPPASPSGRVNVFTVGNARCYPVMQLWGPCAFPRIDNLQDVNAAGVPKQLAFDIALSAGQYLEVDTRERTVLLNGNPNQPRYSTLDFAVSEWWTLASGNNFVKYFPDSFSGNARAVMLYRCTFL